MQPAFLIEDDADLRPNIVQDHDLRDYFYPHDAGLYPPPGDPFVVDGLIPRKSLVLLSAPPKSGKTDLATALAASVARGEPFCGRTVRKGPVLLANYEENARERREVLSRLPGATGSGEVPDLWHGENLPGIDTEVGLELLDLFCKENDPILIVIDSLHAAVDRTNLAGGRAARRALNGLADLAARTGCAILVLHHTDRRGLRPAEHDQIQAACGASIVLRSAPHPTEPDARLLTLAYGGRGLGLGYRRTARLVSDASLSYRAATEEDVVDLGPDTQNDVTASRIVRSLADARATANDLATRLDLPVGTVKNAIQRLLRAKVISIESAAGGAHTYTLEGP